MVIVADKVISIIINYDKKLTTMAIVADKVIGIIINYDNN